MQPGDVPIAPPAGIVDPALARAIAEASSADYIPVVIVLREQADLRPFTRSQVVGLHQREDVVAALRARSETSQIPLKAYLDGAKGAGLVESYSSFWIFNGMAARAQAAWVRSLAAHPAVGVVYLDQARNWLTGSDATFVADHPCLASEDVDDSSVTPAWGVTRIRADQVWDSLGISGAGAVVAGMDSGVDWNHPALQTNYRGYAGHGLVTHHANWFDAVNGSLYPTDDNGHGTHTLGTAVGQVGIGVAPDARWIAVKVLNSNGVGYDSWIHAGFQWLLAPGGDPANAPDVVNCSWGSDIGALTVFQDDLIALRAAGIVPIFSSGNAGPASGTVGSPASLPQALAVGALDENDAVATFSSRGPSPWDEIRPHVTAPGVNIRSSLPGGVYGQSNGTSMAAPHVSGIVALLRAISPTLTVPQATFVVTSTAVQIGEVVPNNDTGWGRADALNAAIALLTPGFLVGRVMDADAAPIPSSVVTAVSRDGTRRGQVAVEPDGRYALTLMPDTYDVTASAFGYAASSALARMVAAGESVTEDFQLTALPAGTLNIAINEALTERPITATVRVLDTPIEMITSSVAVSLPVNHYTIQAARLGYRLITATTQIVAGEATTLTLALPPAPSIVLVDSGPWYYRSQIAYFRQALDDLAFVYDEWPIQRLPDDVPSASALTPYDIVVWSAPEDAPGYIGASSAITGYLSSGGRLFLSGQDIGYFDDGDGGYAPYYRQYLKAGLSNDTSGVWTLKGLPGEIYAGLAFTIAGTGGANNQHYPDEIFVTDRDSASSVLSYSGGGLGGLAASTCLDYRSVYLSFGLEAITDRSARGEVMDRALAWLMDHPPGAGLDLNPVVDTQIGLPGSPITHTVRLRNTGQSGGVETFQASIESTGWNAQIAPSSLTLAPCTSATLRVTVTAPISAGWHARNVVTLTATALSSPTLQQTAVLTSKTPAPILLVDDDRWYEQVDSYEHAMRVAGLNYDLWQTCTAIGSCDDNSPPLDVLRLYPIVIWWTGYDWYRPVTQAERMALEAYIASGGRLFLSSQDFLYFHGDSLLSTAYFGVLGYVQDITPTLIYGVSENRIGQGFGPWELRYPSGYQNWSDGVDPQPGAEIAFRDGERRGLQIVRRGPNYATAFLSFPFEALPALNRADVMRQNVGWLSWLGGATFEPDRGAASPGEVLTYTLVARNDGAAMVSVSLSNTLPVGLVILPDSILGGAEYDAVSHCMTWDGELHPGAVRRFSYQAVVSETIPSGSAISNVVLIHLRDHGIRFSRTAAVNVGTPDLAGSSLRFTPSTVHTSGEVTGTLTLINTGPGTAISATAVVSPPVGTEIVVGSLRSSVGAASLINNTLLWEGTLMPQVLVTVTCRLTLPGGVQTRTLYSVAFIHDGQGGAWERPVWLKVRPWRRYFPAVLRS
ncbi:MAG: S8 family serine peptidase [Chloroflexi bacterium]|nr:S8 family serine peptidase [Chloroflexota bacterium]